jgi:hypothetical protein
MVSAGIATAAAAPALRQSGRPAIQHKHDGCVEAGQGCGSSRRAQDKAVAAQALDSSGQLEQQVSTVWLREDRQYVRARTMQQQQQRPQDKGCLQDTRQGSRGW